jgi:hypothetical protein
MDDAQEQRYLAQADRHIAELKVHIAQQRVMIKRMVEAGQSTEVAESMLETLDAMLRAVELHRKFILSRVERDN